MSVRIGFVGVGLIAISHLVNLQQNPDAEVVALCDLSLERVESAKEQVNRKIAGLNQKGSQFPLLEGVAYADLSTMLKREELDALYVALPPFAHGEPEKMAIEAGVHLFVEKPVALNMGLAREISSLIEERQLISSVGYQLRYSDLVDRAKVLLKDRRVGMVITTRVGGVPGAPWWKVQSKSGGQLVEQATHEMDLLRYLIGEIESVYASAGTRLLSSQPNFDIYDVNAMTITFEDGTVGTFANSCAAYYGSPRGARGINIIAEDMGLSYNHSSLQILTSNGEEELKLGVSPMALADNAFVEAVKSGDASRIRSPYSDALRTLAVTLAAELSVRDKRPVAVDELL